MPVSQPYNIEAICELIKDKKPYSILDVGCGFGLWGFLARIYSGLWKRDITIEEYTNWKSLNKIDAIEVFKPWITDLQRMIYDKIYIGDVSSLIRFADEYDMIIMSDVLEHLEKAEAENVLRIARNKAKTVIISMPTRFYKGEAKAGNEHEIHKYIWQDDDFPDNPKIIKNYDYRVIVYDRNSNV